jgi:pSer/pThr/pTyr-binding forkhead associated (FHA) protein
MNMIIQSPVRIVEAGYNAKHGPNTSESSVVTWLMNVTWSYYRDNDIVVDMVCVSRIFVIMLYELFAYLCIC